MREPKAPVNWGRRDSGVEAGVLHQWPEVRNLGRHMMSICRRTFSIAVCGLAALQPLRVWAADTSYPNRAITIVVPYGPGGVSDVVGRALGDQLSQQLKQPVVIENRAGAAGIIGSAYVARAKPDGYTLLIGNNGSHAIVPLLRKVKPFDPLKDFTLISSALESSNFLAVNQSTPVTNVAEFIEWAKTSKEPLTYGTPGLGSFGHMTTELMLEGLGIEATHIPYKGTGPALVDLLGNQIQFMVDPAVILPAHVDRLRVLASAAPERFPGAPDIPTFKELGHEFSIKGWQGLMAPAGLPDDIRDKLAAAVAIAAQDPSFQQMLAGVGSVAVADGPQGFTKRMQQDIALYTSIKERVGLQEE